MQWILVNIMLKPTRNLLLRWLHRTVSKITAGVVHVTVCTIGEQLEAIDFTLPQVD